MIVSGAVPLTLSAVVPRAAHAASAELVVSVAASLADAIAEVKPLFEAAYPAVRLVINSGSSGALQQQIERGAPVDVFIAAAAAPVDRLVQRGFIDRSAVRDLVVNRLVLIRPARPPSSARPANPARSPSPASLANPASPASPARPADSSADPVSNWADLAGDRIRRVAIGNPEHVPAGIYGKQVLESLALWEVVRSKLVIGEDARQVLQYVRLGEVDAGIVYMTDAASTPDVTVVAEAPRGSHEPIVYPAAPIRTSRRIAEARLFLEFLFSETGRQILIKHGFSPPEWAE